MTAGRPTVYKDTFPDDLIEMFSVGPFLKGKYGEYLFNAAGRPVPAPFPTLARFAGNIGVTRETLHDWATATNEDGSPKKPEFSYAYKICKELQEATLIEGGLSGVYNSAFAGLATQNIINWRSKADVDEKSEQSLTVVIKNYQVDGKESA